MSFPESIDRARRIARLAALGIVGAVVAAAAFSIGATVASSASRPRVHPAMRDGPPLAHTGGFGEPTCLACHFDGELNDSAGSLVIDGVPAHYEGGKRYPLTITVRHPELKLAGFELSSRFATGADSGRQAGTLATTDDRAGVTADDTTRIQYAHHLRSGTTPFSDGVGRWTIEWVAPASSSAPIVFHVAANAANDNDSPLGDYIFARSVRTPTAAK